MKKILLLWFVPLAIGLASVIAEVAPLPVEIAPTDSRLRYVGRFETQDSDGPRCSWSASTVVLKVSGGSVNVKIKDGGKNFWQVIVDGVPKAVLAMEAGSQRYSVVTDLPEGDHTVELVKRTEAFLGASQIQGFQISDDKQLRPGTPATRRIEVIGDSISCGYGNEGANEKEPFLPATENASKAYGAVAARQVGADYVCIAWSGKKLWPDNTITELYDLILPAGESTAKWNFASWTPDVVLINLGTNDFGKENPDEAGWVAAYKTFIGTIRKNYPKARIYCATGSMMNDFWPPEHKALTTVRRYISKVIADLRAAGDDNLAAIDFDPQNKDKNGLGAGWHPSVKTDQEMADKFVAALKKDLDW